MRDAQWRFQFRPNVNLSEAESTLRLSLLAAEGLFGEARVRTEVTYMVEPLRSAIYLSGSKPVVEAVAQMFTSLLSHEFGRGAFTAEPDSILAPTRT
jgi:hypothetical protein